jgi:hypothetical protein
MQDNMTTTETTTETTTPAFDASAPVATSKQAQSILAVSPEFKAFFAQTGAENVAPGKTGKNKRMSEREIGNALLAFVTDPVNRYELRENVADDGTVEVYEFDKWAHELKRELALRDTPTVPKVKALEDSNAKLKAEMEALRAQLAALIGNA